MERLKKRSEFLACAATGHKWVRPAFVLQLRQRDKEEIHSAPRLGFTTTRKLGNAVCRNRIRRRLREAARLILSAQAKSGYDYVLIGRPAAAEIDFAQLQKEMMDGMRQLHYLVHKQQQRNEKT